MFEAENIELLAVLFFFTAVFYSLVGFGGGSTYISLLALFGVSQVVAPAVALVCNITVVTGGAFHFYRNRRISMPLIFPFLILSVPLAYIGGRVFVDQDVYQFILACTLFVAGLKILFFKKKYMFIDQYRSSTPAFFPALIIGGILGFISGIVGIGGGIFLAPILYIKSWGKPKTIAATTTIFILINSISGLIGQIQKTEEIVTFNPYIILILTVFLGGQVGSWLCNYRIEHRKVELLTSVLILFVSFKLFSITLPAMWRFFNL